MLRLSTLLILLLSGCHSIDPYLATDVVGDPERYVIVTPSGRDRLVSVQRFVAQKESEGYDVRVVTFEPGGPTSDRLTEVRRHLDDHEPDDARRAYVLFLATGEELPMGPWRIEGSAETIESDLPILVGHTDPETPLTESDWWLAVGPESRWIPGRIPFGDPELLDRALSVSEAYAARANPPLAMLGSERYAVWWDTSLVMSRARVPLEDRGWKTITYSQDSPGDVELGLTDGDELVETYTIVGLTLDPAELEARRSFLTSLDSSLADFLEYDDPEDAPTNDDVLFVSHWAELSPDVVYLNSHGSSFFSTSVGKNLVSAYDIERLIEQGDGVRSQPDQPALVVIAACRAGTPESDLTAALFEHGYASAVVASTELTNPRPIHVAIRAEIDAGTALASGLTVGLGMRAVRLSYLEDARSTWSYSLFDGTGAAVAQNLLAITIYGDPSMPMRAAAAWGEETE